MRSRVSGWAWKKKPWLLSTWKWPQCLPAEHKQFYRKLKPDKTTVVILLEQEHNKTK